MSDVTATVFVAKPCPVCGVPNIDYFCVPCTKRELDSRMDPRLMTAWERYQEVRGFRGDVKPFIQGILLERVAKLTGKKLPDAEIPVAKVMERHRVWTGLGFPQFWLKEGDWDKLAEQARDAYPPLIKG